MAEKKISLVLGSGGARGLAHIGVLRCLSDNDFVIDYIAGSSMGALVGGIFAAGELDTYADWVTALSRRDVMRLLDWSFSQGSVFKGDRIIAELESLLGEQQIEDLEIGFTAVAADLNGMREVWLSEGSLWDAIRASIAVPLVFAPVKRGELLLVDGGLVNPVPIAPTFNSQARLTFAVDLNGRARGGGERGAADAERDVGGGDEADEDGANDDAQSGLSAIRARVRGFVDKLTGDLPSMELHVPQAFELALRSMDTMQVSISRMKLAAYSPQVLITVPRNLASFFDFHRAQELIDYGYRATERALKDDPY